MTGKDWKLQVAREHENFEPCIFYSAWVDSGRSEWLTVRDCCSVSN